MNLKTIALAAGVSLAAISIATPAVEAGTQSAQVGASQPARSEVALIEQGSALLVRATINGTATFTFEIDTGAGIVVLPRSVAAKLVTAADFLGCGHTSSAMAGSVFSRPIDCVPLRSEV